MNLTYPKEMWEQRYSAEAYAFGKTPNEYLVSVANLFPSGPILCLAEGQGRNAVFLAELGHTVVAVDGSENGMAKARLLADERGVVIKTVVRDLADFIIEPDTWSGIVSIFAHLPATLRRQIHQRAVEGLVPGGIFVLEAYRPAQIGRGTGGPSSSDTMMDLESLRSELCGLEIVIGQETEREVVEGAYHTGMAAVVQIAARRPV